ncbi:glycosyltransferase family 90 protein [Sodiomyces alcalophilus JCM 7366]|uniref:glycosyltransferase family 90 protein n=1 Tax=Sodiomyces alcalophilus JCM 7366 TaxID=591952 RepID=UPI0039B695F1
MICGRRLRLAIPAIIVVLSFFGSILYLLGARSPTSFNTTIHKALEWSQRSSAQGHGHPQPEAGTNDSHPIDDLINDAQSAFRQLLGKRSLTLEQAAWRYRERRGRHPPPGFDAWFAAAAESDAIIVEDFFDRIHHDISPLWGLEPAELRRRSRHHESVIRVRAGNVEIDTAIKGELPHRLRQWTKLVAELSPHIPDLDMPLNTMDESRVLVPWEQVAEYVDTERRGRLFQSIGDTVSEYSGLGPNETATAASPDDHHQDKYDPNWIRSEPTKYWDHFRVACPPDSPARNLSALSSFDVPVDYPSGPSPGYTYNGYVRNFTASQDPCLQPHLRGMHGTFVESISMSTTHDMVPLFGECKLPQNNELLIPGAVYLDDDLTKYSGGKGRGGPWHRKKDGLVWRGVSSGARNKRHNWWHIHRHRFVQMLNGTAISAVEADRTTNQAKTFALVPPDVYDLDVQAQGRLGEWVSSFADVGFVDILCDPPDFYEHWWKGKQRLKTCRFVAPYFSVASEVSMAKQYGFKFLPDVDGNSFSGRYRAFLLSTSLPLKSTIYAEWHDSRLFPWVHFVPFDNSFMDIYGIMDYFLNGHDKEAERIAAEGKTWAEAVLRREDMRLYVWRLLLEYARVIDDNRDRLAFVDDWRA